MSLWRETVKKFLLKRNMILSRPPGQFAEPIYKLQGWKRRGLNVAMAIDGGSATGGMAEFLTQLFPGCKVLCIDPRDDVQPPLRQLAARLPGITIAQTLIGDTDGTVEFYEHADQSSMLPHSTEGAFGKVVRAPVQTLDGLVAKLNLPQPDFIKLDLQGAELKALAGASELLKNTQAVLTEISFIPFQAGNALVGDVVTFLRDRGFRLVDVFGLWHRPLDGALAQGDFFFVKEGHPLLADTRWSEKGAWGQT
jgi:FkbM family methyltransferase